MACTCTRAEDNENIKEKEGEEELRKQEVKYIRRQEDGSEGG